jgi:DNA-directed RNA polymerase subunit alpha
MRIRWRNLELPTRVVADPATRTDTYAKFTAEPFERGYGVTVGNGLRRVLLASIEGTAVTSVKIQGVKHEFSSIEGVKEDVTDVVLALKRLRVRFHDDDPKVLKIEKRGPGPVTGADVQTGPDCEVVTKDLVLCTLTTDRTFEAEIEVRKGRGYVTQEENAREEHEIGVIPMDAVFSPVQRVRYRTENTRVGKMTNYDRLIVELWTDGTVTPEMALVEAGKIYRKHLNPFVQFFDLGKELPPEGLPSAAPRPAAAAPGGAAGDELRRKLEMPVASLDLSVRASNSLEAEGIRTVGDLVSRTEEEMANLKNFGRTSLKEVQKKLEPLGLAFGMDAGAAR